MAFPGPRHVSECLEFPLSFLFHQVFILSTRLYETAKQVEGIWTWPCPYPLQRDIFPSILPSSRANRRLHRMRGGWPRVVLARKPCATLCQTSHAGSRWEHTSGDTTDATATTEHGRGKPRCLAQNQARDQREAIRQGSSAREERQEWYDMRRARLDCCSCSCNAGLWLVWCMSASSCEL